MWYEQGLFAKLQFRVAAYLCVFGAPSDACWLLVLRVVEMRSVFAVAAWWVCGRCGSQWLHVVCCFAVGRGGGCLGGWKGLLRRVRSSHLRGGWVQTELVGSGFRGVCA